MSPHVKDFRVPLCQGHKTKKNDRVSRGLGTKKALRFHEKSQVQDVHDISLDAEMF